MSLPTDTPTQLCECGCGDPAPIATKTDPARGYVRGKPRRFIHGHNRSNQRDDRWRIEDRGYTTPCWTWLLARLDFGYPVMKKPGAPQGTTVRAHRWYYEQAKGPIPDGLQLDHLCNHPDCVNPDHLEPVTNAENSRRRPSNKLNPDLAAEIREARHEPIRVLAERYGVSERAIHGVRYGQRWAT